MSPQNKDGEVLRAAKKAPPVSNRVMFELTSFDAHDLLKELEFCCQFVNRNNDRTKELWTQIANQLKGISYDDIQDHISRQNASNSNG